MPLPGVTEHPLDFSLLFHPVQDMGEDHGCFHVLMPVQPLHSADIVTVLKQMRGEGTPESTLAQAGCFEGENEPFKQSSSG